MSRTRVAVFLELSRPFTLVAPALGFASGAVTAAGAVPRDVFSRDLVLFPVIGLTMAAVLNAASNALNQIYDLEIDRVNKPRRPLPSGRMSIAEAWLFTAGGYAVALLLAWLVAPGGRRECFWIVVAATLMTFVYSMPPFRTKRLGIWANVTIAIPRGVLLKVAGWSAVKTVAGILTGNPILLYTLSAVMTFYGIYVCYLMLRRPEDLAVEENHVSWAHMYRMMFVAQIGFALAYLF